MSSLYECPECRTKCTSLKSLPTLTKFIDSTFVRCIHSPYGCEWKGPQGDAKAHLELHCKFREDSRPCEYCGLDIPGLRLEWHVKNECSKSGDVPDRGCNRRKRYRHHAQALEHDEKTCVHSSTFQCTTCHRQQCDHDTTQEHIADLYNSVEEMKTLIAGLTAGKKVKISDSVQIELPLDDLRAQVSLTSSYKVAKYGVKVHLGDEVIWGLFELETYDKVRFRCLCSGDVKVSLYLNGQRRKSKSFMVSTKRWKDKRSIVVRMNVSTYVDSWSPVKPRVIEPRMYAPPCEDVGQCTETGDVEPIPELPQ